MVGTSEESVGRASGSIVKKKVETLVLKELNNSHQMLRNKSFMSAPCLGKDNDIEDVRMHSSLDKSYGGIGSHSMLEQVVDDKY